MTMDRHDRFTWSPNDIEIVDGIEKHTPGGHEHDQDKHGDRAGAGASTPVFDGTARRAADDFIDRGENIPAQTGLDYSSERLNKIRGAAKAKIVEDVAARLSRNAAFRASYSDGVRDPERGISTDDERYIAMDAQDTVDRALAQWSTSARDQDPYSLALQLAAAEEFDLPKDSAEQMAIGVGSYTMERTLNVLRDPHVRAPWSSPMLRPMLRAMYEHTQEELKQAGVELVTLFRGIRPTSHESGSETMPWMQQMDYDPEKGHRPRREQAFLQNPLSSWSSSIHVATEFAGPRGAVLTATFPPERILGTARTGFGSLPEFEWVVMAGAGTVLVDPSSDMR